MTNNTYNGWTNHATWRVNLEIFDGLDLASDNDLDAYDLGQTLRDFAEEAISNESGTLAYSYALAFMSDVNWNEIAAHMIEDYRTEEAA